MSTTTDRQLEAKSLLHQTDNLQQNLYLQQPSISITSKFQNEDILIKLRDALKDWISKREKTIAAMEELADDIKATGEVANGVKIAGSILGVVAGIVGVAAIIGTGGLATPLVAGGAAVAGLGAAGVTGTAEVVKSVKFASLLDEAGEKIDGEFDMFKIVVDSLEPLYEANSDEGGEMKEPTSEKDLEYREALIFTRMYWRMKENGIKCAAHAAKEAVEAIVATKSTLPKAVIEAATEAAEDAAYIVILEFLFRGYKEGFHDPAVELAKKAAEATIDTAGKSASKDGADFSKDKLKVAAQAATYPVSKILVKRFLKNGAKGVGKVAGVVAGKAAGKAVGRSIPLLNIGFAVWDTVDGVNAGVQMATGSEEENQLRQKIKSLKEEANTLVLKVYNYFADKERPRMPELDFPFPGTGCS